MSIFQKYQKEFREMSDGVFDIYQNIYSGTESHLNYLKNNTTTQRSIYSLNREDLNQQLKLIWLELEQQFELNQPKVSLKTYLIRMSTWIIRDWFNHEMKILYTQNLEPPPEELPFNINIQFLYLGSDWYPLSNLTTYERYILYLKYNKEMTIQEIAFKLKRDRGLVGIQLHSILNKIRSRIYVKPNENTERYC